MLASFPFPREAGNIVRGDYANALFHMDINLNTVIKSPGDVLPNLINLCSALPLAGLCRRSRRSAQGHRVRCRSGRDVVTDLAVSSGQPGVEPNKPTPVPGVGGLPGSGSSGSSGSGGLGGLGGLLGGGGGG